MLPEKIKFRIQIQAFMLFLACGTNIFFTNSPQGNGNYEKVAIALNNYRSPYERSY